MARRRGILRKAGLAAATLAVLLAAFPLPAAAQPVVSASSSEYRGAVVELYTSEGCSSCPPADEWLASLGEMEGEEFSVVPLAFHVDYWNSLGWADPYSRPAWSERQRAVAARNGQATVYTPEFVVDGREVRGTRRILEAVMAVNATPARVSIRLRATLPEPKRLVVEATVSGLSPVELGNARIHAALYENDLGGVIPTGENAGRTLHHDYVVRSWAGPLRAKTAVSQRIEFSLDDSWKRQDLGLAVLVVDDASGRPLQALKAPLAALFRRSAPAE